MVHFRVVVFFILGVLFFPSSFASLYSDLALWYDFESANIDVGASNVYDYSDAGNDGIIYNDVNFSGTGGFDGGGYVSFNGDSQYLSVPSFGLSNTGFAVSFWYKFTNYSVSSMGLFDGGTYQSSGFSIYHSSESSLFFLVNGNSQTLQKACSDCVDDSDWHYYTMTYVDNGIFQDMSIYKDGVYVDHDNSSSFTMVQNLGAINVGVRDSKYLNGSLDDIRIFNRSLSSSEIMLMYASRGGSPEVDPYDQVLYVQFNNDSYLGENSTYVVDISGVSEEDYNESLGNHLPNNGVVYGSPIYQSIQGPLLDGAYFFNDSISGQYIDFGNNETLQMEDFTVSFWANSSNFNANSPLGKRGNLGGFYSGWDLSFFSGRLRFYYNNLSNSERYVESNTGAYVNGEPGYYVVTKEGDLISFYVNGLPAGSSYLDSGGMNNNSLNSLVVGRRYYTKDDNAWNGTVDDVILSKDIWTSDYVEAVYDNYVSTSECGNSPNSTAQYEGCKVRELKPTTWQSQDLYFSGPVGVSNAELNIFSSTVLFNNSKLYVIPNQEDVVTIENSSISWIDKTSLSSVISLSYNSILTIKNSSLSNLYWIYGNHYGGLEIFNSNLQNAQSTFVETYGTNYVNIQNSTFNSTALNHGIKIKKDVWVSGDTNWTFYNNTITNSYWTGLFAYQNYTSLSATYNNISNTHRHGMAFPYGLNAYVANNYVQNVSGYGIDFYGTGQNHLVENNTIVNSGYGIAFSMGDGGIGNSYNLTSRNNRVYNLTAQKGIYFNTVDGGYSYNDYVEGGTPERCLGVSTNARNIYSENLTCVDLPNYGLHSNVNVFNITYTNFTLLNVSIDFYVSKTSNITFQDSMEDTSEELVGIIEDDTVSEVTFSEVANWSWYLDAPQALNFTFNSTDLSFTSFSASDNLVQLYDLSNVFVKFSNGTSFFFCGGDLNFTLLSGDGVSLRYIQHSLLSGEFVSSLDSSVNVSVSSDSYFSGLVCGLSSVYFYDFSDEGFFNSSQYLVYIDENFSSPLLEINSSGFSFYNVSFDEGGVFTAPLYYFSVLPDLSFGVLSSDLNISSLIYDFSFVDSLTDYLVSGFSFGSYVFGAANLRIYYSYFLENSSYNWTFSKAGYPSEAFVFEVGSYEGTSINEVYFIDPTVIYSSGSSSSDSQDNSTLANVSVSGGGSGGSSYLDYLRSLFDLSSDNSNVISAQSTEGDIVQNIAIDQSTNFYWVFGGFFFGVLFLLFMVFQLFQQRKRRSER